MHSGFLFLLGVKASPTQSTMALIEEEPEDPWDLPDLKDAGVPWSGEALQSNVQTFDYYMRTIILYLNH